MMPLDQMKSFEAKAKLRGNLLGVWPDGRRKSHRMGLYASCAPNPSFSFSQDDMIFTSGSCFARNIENRLSRFGFNLAVPNDPVLRKGLINKYISRSALDELRWGFGVESFPVESLVEVSPGLYHDPHLHPSSQQPVSLERALARRSEIDAIVRKLVDCRVFILTLGLVETWVDTKAGCWLNGIPPAAAITAEPERYEFVRQSFSDVTNDLEDMLALLKKHAHPDIKMLVTVSPVPFKATHTGQDAIAANTYSKSVLRAAAEHFTQRHEDVNYFPSFEMVTLSDRSVAYLPDNIHVQDGMVDRIMVAALRAYAPQIEVDDPPNEPLPVVGSSPDAIYAAALTASTNGEHMLAVRLLQKLESSWDFEALPIGVAEFYFLLGNTLARTPSGGGKLTINAIYYYYRLALKQAPLDKGMWLNCGNTLNTLGSPKAAEFLAEAQRLSSLDQKP